MTEWGPWIEHDGKGCPCVGQFVHVVFKRDVKPKNSGAGSGRYINKREWIGITNPTSAGGSWNWNTGFVPIVRYRIRKPRGLTILENLISDLPVPVGPKVDA
jgi:hypothetical protein